MKNKDFYLGMKKSGFDPDKEVDRIVCIMVCELDVEVGRKKVSSSLIHYICTYPTMKCKGYATKVLKLVFAQESLSNKVVYAVSKIPLSHVPTHSIVDLECPRVQKSTRMQKILMLPENNSDGFLSKFKFTKKKFLDDDHNVVPIDQCDGLIFEGSEHMISDAVVLRNYMSHHSNGSLLYDIDSNVKFSLTCDKDKLLYAKNPHYGWQRCTAAQTLNLPLSKVKYARDFIGKEVILNSGGSRDKAMASIDEKCEDVLEPIPIEYQQESGSVKNSCVWLAACLVVRSVDVDLATILLAKYTENPSKFEWLNFFNNRQQTCASLYTYFQWTTECKLVVSRVRIPKDIFSMDLTQYILHVRNKGIIVAMLQDKVGNGSHTVGINLETQLIYDCQEQFVLQLNLANLSVCCGPNMIFDKFTRVAELK